MACTSFPTVVVTSRPRGLGGRLLLTAAFASVFSGAYGAFVYSEAVRPMHGGSLALYTVGFGLALAASIGAWAAVSRRAWGLSVAAVAAQGNLFLLASATLLALGEAFAGIGTRGPVVALAALGALQAATVVLAAAPSAAPAGGSR
jgi:hypothetical protein